MDSKERDNPLRKEKRSKLEKLLKLSVNPYPHTYKKSHSISQVLEREKHIKTGESSSKIYILAGRILLKRDMGKAAFFNVQDEGGNLQCYIRKDDFLKVVSSLESGTGEGIANQNSKPKSEADASNSRKESKNCSSWDLWKLSDIGDIVGVKGTVFRTRKGELSLRIQEYQMLCKSLELLPEKYHGLEDVELKYRYRHLDLIMDLKSREVFKVRSKIIQEIRSFMNKRGFMEVETPVLQPIYGGASALPFTTHHRRLNRDLYLKISPEIYLKKLLVGGFEKVYEIGKNFRNEGIDRTHNPEFTMMEYYEAYTDYHDQMKQFKNLICHITKKIKGSLKFKYQGRDLDFSNWEKVTVKQGISKYGGFDVDQINDLELCEKIKALDSEAVSAKAFESCQTDVTDQERYEECRDAMIMEAFELTVEPKLKEAHWNPVFITDFPLGVSPLTKRHRKWSKKIKNGKHFRIVERFEPYIAGMEVGNAYTELNDPLEQERRLRLQQKRENHPLDENFIHALQVGLPPTGGVGLGIERLVMILTDTNSIKDSLLFPLLRS